MKTSEWVIGLEAWARFSKQHPELALDPGHWTFHNFLRLHRPNLLLADAIRKARGKWWIAHVERFPVAAFDCATAKFAREA